MTPPLIIAAQCASSAATELLLAYRDSLVDTAITALPEGIIGELTEALAIAINHELDALELETGACGADERCELGQLLAAIRKWENR